MPSNVRRIVTNTISRLYFKSKLPPPGRLFAAMVSRRPIDWMRPSQTCRANRTGRTMHQLTPNRTNSDGPDDKELSALRALRLSIRLSSLPHLPQLLP